MSNSSQFDCRKNRNRFLIFLILNDIYAFLLQPKIPIVEKIFFIFIVFPKQMLQSISRFSSNLQLKKPLVKSFSQISEFDHPTDIITHCPGVETRFPFHLSAFLYENPPDPDKAVECHNLFRKALHDACGAKVWTVREILKEMPVEKLRSTLIDFTDLQFDVVPGIPTEQMRKQITKDYISYSLSRLSKDNLIDLIFMHPSVKIDVDKNSSTGFHYDKLPLLPLANTVFTRDQQITTAKGVVIGRFGAQQRRDENKLMKVVWAELGIEPVGQINGPGTLEGGDFIPISEDYCMLGVGLRTKMTAAKQLMNQDLLGTKRFIVVEDLYDKNQQRMHLDTYFNVASEKLCVCVDKIAEDDPKYIRIAREFVRDGVNSYKEVSQLPFGKWLKKEGFEVVPASFKQQEDYFINLLHLGKNKNGKDIVFAINPEVEKALKQRGFDGEVHYLDFHEITAMYGGAHCASQVLRQHK